MGCGLSAFRGCHQLPKPLLGQPSHSPNTEPPILLQLCLWTQRLILNLPEAIHEVCLMHVFLLLV